MADVLQNVSDWVHEFRWNPETLPMATWEYPFGGAVIYFCLIKLIQKTTSVDRRIKSVEIVHNAFLVLLSFSMLCLVLYGAFLRYKAKGTVVGSILCSTVDEKELWDGPIGAAVYIFYLSKYYEFLDTIFMAFKQKDIMFLHSWHHMIMPVLCWSWFYYPWLDGAWWCCFVNSFVHTIMYSYYLASTLGIKVWFKKYITSLQIFQFCTGFAFSGAFMWMQFSDMGCTGNTWTCIASNGVNVSFLFLFMEFYTKSYKSTPGNSRAASPTKKME